jgi:hypothetical protein
MLNYYCTIPQLQHPYIQTDINIAADPLQQSSWELIAQKKEKLDCSLPEIISDVPTERRKLTAVAALDVPPAIGQDRLGPGMSSIDRQHHWITEVNKAIFKFS